MSDAEMFIKVKGGFYDKIELVKVKQHYHSGFIIAVSVTFPTSNYGFSKHS